VPSLDETGRAPRRAVLIVNPRSGGGKAGRADVVAACQARGIETVVLTPDDDVDEMARAAAADADVIGVAGGDGSMAAVAAVAARRDIPFVCIPAGTRNHFAFDLGIDRRDVVGALDAFEGRNERRIDLAAVNGRPFVNNVSIGWYGKVVASPEYRDAKLKRVLKMLPELLDPRGGPARVRFTGPGGKQYAGVRVLLVSNNRYEFDRPMPRGARGGVDRGVLGLLAISPPVGNPEEPRGLLEWTAPSFRVDADSPLVVGIDGEAVTLAPPFEFEPLPHALRVWLPPPRQGFIAPRAPA